MKLTPLPGKLLCCPGWMPLKPRLFWKNSAGSLMPEIPSESGEGWMLPVVFLQKPFGDSRAEEILMKSAPELLNIPFAFLNRLSFDQLTGILKDESPRTLALIMNHINRTFALKLLKILPGGPFRQKLLSVWFGQNGFPRRL